MKKINIIIFYLLCLSILKAQDIEPAQRTFDFKGNANYYLSKDSTYFQQDKFLIGWAWSYGKKMSEAMLYLSQNQLF